MMSKIFSNGLIIGTDHSTSVDFDSQVSKLEDQPKAVLFEAPVNDGVYKAMNGVTSDQASKWAHNNNIQTDTFDTVSRNRKANNEYDMNGIKKIISGSGNANQIRSQLRNNHSQFYNEMLVERENEMAKNINYQINRYGSPVLIVVGQLHVPKLMKLLS